uniref:Protein kinase domain-containing protein n=1 Tax=viral metagenome TaxID=1070528 RepID=A0A6C0ASR7_9ZZZZ
MNTNIEISTLLNHFLLDNEKDVENIDKNSQKKYKTKIINQCFYSINEANISEIIKEIPYYSKSYLIIENYEFIDIRQLNDTVLEKLNFDIKDVKYLLFKYKNIKCLPFNDFLFYITTHPKILIFYLIDIFSYLLQGLIQLNEHNICFFNLSYKNIVFDLDCREKPLLEDFKYSLQLSKLSVSYISNIIKNLNDYRLKPFEVHVLFYLIKNDINTISYSFIEQICEIYIKKFNILEFFSESYKEKYKLACIKSLEKYVNKPKNDIILDILEQHDKWDVYSISHIFLHIFGSMSRFFSLKNTFINKITIELAKNIHPDPSKRSDLSTLLKNYQNLLDGEKDWSFVNHMNSSKMKEFFDILYE